MKAKSGIALAMAAGFVATSAANAAVDERQAQTGLRSMKSMPVGHIYYNPATGERVVTPFENRPRAASPGIWINNNTDPCATGGTVGVIDDPDLDGDGAGDLFGGACVGGTFPCEGTWNNFWGDVAYDSVVDCLVVAYGILAPDNDADLDSIGDGIVGYDMALTFSDNDDGFGSDLPGVSGRSCILDLTIPTLAGATGAVPPGFVAVYILTLDFASLAPSLIFELGDSDGVDDAGTGISGGALYGPNNIDPGTGLPYPNPSSGIDWDSNMLADFSFAFRFDQSTLGTTGAPGVSKGVNGFLAAAPKLGNPGDLPADPADATGLFDALDIYSTGPQCTASAIPNALYIGTFFFGGFTCAVGAETPHASAWIELYGPNGPVDPGCNGADLAEPFGTLDFSDVIAFLTAFGTGIPGGEAADLADPIGTLDFSDVIAFLTLFGAGCP